MTLAKGHLSNTESQVSHIRTIGPLVFDVGRVIMILKADFHGLHQAKKLFLEFLVCLFLLWIGILVMFYFVHMRTWDFSTSRTYCEENFVLRYF